MVGFVEGCRRNPRGAVLSRSVGSLLLTGWVRTPDPGRKQAFTKAGRRPGESCLSVWSSRGLGLSICGSIVHCRSKARLHPPASGLDSQLCRGHSGFHRSAGRSGRRRPVTARPGGRRPRGAGCYTSDCLKWGVPRFRLTSQSETVLQNLSARWSCLTFCQQKHQWKENKDPSVKCLNCDANVLLMVSR